MKCQQISSHCTLLFANYTSLMTLFLIIERLFWSVIAHLRLVTHHHTLLQSSCPCSIDNAFLSSTKSNALVMLVPMLPPSTTTTPSVYFYLCLRLFLKVDWELLIEGPTASLFRGSGRKQSTLTQKPSGATSILIFLTRHTYLYIGLHQD